MATLLDAAPILATFQILALCGFITTFIGFAILYFVAIHYPSNLPRVREPAGATRFTLKTRLAFLTDCKALFNEAYEKVSLSHWVCIDNERKLISELVF